jgi:hypothetical protein
VLLMLKKLDGVYHEETINDVKYVVRYVGKDDLGEPIYKVTAESIYFKQLTLGFATTVQEAIQDCVQSIKNKPLDWFVRTYSIKTN